MQNAPAAVIGLALTMMACAALAQPAIPRVPTVASPEAIEHENTIRINVQVSTKKGDPVPGLKQSNFTLLDNNQPRQIASLRQMGRANQQVEAILVLDAVNTRFEDVSFERLQLDKFIKQTGGKLPLPMTLAVLTDKGVQMQPSFTQDTGVLSNLVENSQIQLREITRAAGFWGADERMETSIRAIQQLVVYAGGLPGRKLILYLSPGWPLLSGPDITLSAKQREEIFSDVINFSTMARRADVTLDALDPLGPGESLDRENFYMSFLKGLRKANDADLGDMSVQVLALQSGGVAVNSSDIAGTIAKALEDTDAWYEITFQTPPAEMPNEYHHLQLKVDQPALVVRARDGYYDQPASPDRRMLK